MKAHPILFSGPMVRAVLEGRKTQTRRIIKPQPPFGCVYGINGAESHAICSSAENPSNWVPPTPKSTDHRLPCPYGQPGDQLWVKETWGFRGLCWSSERPEIEQEFIHYRADDKKVEIEKPHGFWETDKAKLPKQRLRREGESEHDYNDYLSAYWRQWRPSIYMPRWAGRITLEVTAVRVEQLQDISEEDSEAEGVLNSSGSHDFDCNGKQFHPDAQCDCGSNSLQQVYARLWESINGSGSWAANPWVWVVEFRRVAP